MQKIVPFLWFENQAEDAANFYVSVFGNSKIVNVLRHGEGAPMPAGTVMTVNFQLEGQDFVALNGGPQFTFTPAISLLVNCETQAEMDGIWAKLEDGGSPIDCGWITDKYGLTWQIVPRMLLAWLNDADREKANRVMQAMLQMKKFDLAKLKQAYDGEGEGAGNGD